MSVLQVFGVGALLEVFLERVSALYRRDGTFINGGVVIVVGHGEMIWGKHWYLVFQF